jgi:minor extracellular serine protease Vpr
MLPTRCARTALLAVIALAGCSSADGTPAPSRGAIMTVASSDRLTSLESIPDVDATIADAEAPSVAKPAVRLQARIYTPWHFEFQTEEACAAFQVEGTTLITRFGKFADYYIPNQRSVLTAALNAPGLVWGDQGNAIRIPPPAPSGPAAARGTSEPIVRGGLSGLKGKGVTIVIVDSGLDFRHPDFITQDAQGRPVSRIAYFWDTASADSQKGIGEKGPITYPNGVSVGTVYTRDQLTAELRATERKIGPTDLNGHGTSCAGVAAGNGRAYADRRYSGVAPEADLIAVRVGGSSGRGLENTYLLGAACTWVDGLMAGRPAVFSCSYGGQMGGRDGANVLERQIDARFSEGVKGRAICIAAGNDGQEKLHAATKIGGAQAHGRVSWTVPDATTAIMTLQLSSGDLSDLRWLSSGTTLLEAKQLSAGVNAITKQGHVQFTTGPGTYTLEVWTESGTEATGDGYISRAGGNGVPVFTGPEAVAGKQIGTPGTALRAITVGSYDFNAEVWVKGSTAKQYVGSMKGKEFVPLAAGFLSDYSNPGPRRNGDAVKPDLVAPGQFHTAARSADAPADKNEMIESSGQYRYFNGTSAATPYTAGLIALMFEKNPTLTAGEVAAILHQKASRDKITGVTPNPSWGYGKLDMAAAKALIAAVKAP